MRTRCRTPALAGARARRCTPPKAILLALPCHLGSPGHIHIDTDSADAATAEAVTKAVAAVAALPRVPLFCLMATFPGNERVLPFDAAVCTESAGTAWVALDSSKPVRCIRLMCACVLQCQWDHTGARQLASRGAPHPTPPHPTPPARPFLQGRASSTGSSLVAVTTPQLASALLGAPAQGALPPQTPEYLAERTQRVWDAVQQDLTPARGGWGPACVLADSPVCWPWS